METRKYQRTNLHLTWVGARDTSVSKNHKINLKYQMVLDEPCKEPGDESEADDDKHEKEHHTDNPRPRLVIIFFYGADKVLVVVGFFN